MWACSTYQGRANGVEGVADVGGELTAYEEPEAGVAEGGEPPWGQLHNCTLEPGDAQVLRAFSPSSVPLASKHAASVPGQHDVQASSAGDALEARQQARRPVRFDLSTSDGLDLKMVPPEPPAFGGE